MSNLNAVELSSISGCANSQDCTINTNYNEITNNGIHTTGGSEGIKIYARIDTFINYGIIKVNNGQQTFTFRQSGFINHFINYGTFDNLDKMGIWVDNIYGLGKITNYGIMGSINLGANNKTMNAPLTLNSLGLIGAKNHHIKVESGSKVLIQNYSVMIGETATTFNSFSGNTSNNQNNFSHLVIEISGGNSSITFKDGDSKIILDFGSGFEFGTKYLISKVATNQSGNAALGVDFPRLTTRSDIYDLTQDGDSFIVTLKPHNSTIGNLYKANIRTMNNFLTISNSMIYPHKYSAKRNTNKRRVIRRVKRTANVVDMDCFGESCDSPRKDGWVDSSLQSESNVLISSLRDSALAESWQSTLQSLALNESFAYKSDSSNYYANNLTTNQRANQTNTTRRRITTTNRALSNPSTQSNDKYYFILTPFINHNLFFESGRYNLRGLEYGFLTAFSGKLSPSNVLGTHFMMSYGTIGDSKDKDFSITNLNLNVGLNYKFDMIWDMFLKARGDFFYFLNQVKTLTIPSVKPNTLGFGVSVAYGKDFNFGSGGILGVEGGIDYKALQSNTITLQNSADKSVSETYQKQLYNLIYVDLGITYAKYFNTNAGLWGLNAGLGLKGNVTANKLAKSQIRLSALNHSVDMTLDNDKILSYVNLSGSYVLNHKDFDMEFSLAYYGNYGNRVISNGGGVEWRVVW